MNTTRKITIGLSIAGGALFAAWLLTGSRKQKTKQFVERRTQNLKGVLQKKKEKVFDESDVYYL